MGCFLEHITTKGEFIVAYKDFSSKKKSPDYRNCSHNKSIMLSSVDGIHSCGTNQKAEAEESSAQAAQSVHSAFDHTTPVPIST